MALSVKLVDASNPEVVYSYACGVCHRISSFSKFSASGELPDKDLLESRKLDVENCCLCRSCGAINSRKGEAEEDFEYDTLFCRECAPVEKEKQELRYKEYEEKMKKYEIQHEEALSLALNKESAKLLVREMRDISEDYWCAGWRRSLEYELWETINTYQPCFGSGDLPKHRIDYLKELNQKSGGWWFYGSFGELFVPQDEWLEMYEKYKNKK